MNQEKIVDFRYCKSCKSWKVDENDEPCRDCLLDTTNTDSVKPTRYEKATSGKYPWKETS